MERLATGNHPAEGVTVSVDQHLTAMTDAEGHFRFPEVAEGRHTVALALHELPAEFEVGKNAEVALLVLPSKPSRAELDVVRLGTIQGKVTGPKDVVVEGIVIPNDAGRAIHHPGCGRQFHLLQHARRHLYDCRG